MTPQQIFNKVYLGLRKQGRKSTNGMKDHDGRCLYSAPDGCRCGVGFLVSRKIGKEWDETECGISAIIERGLKGVKPWMEENRGLLGGIQQSHDGIITWDEDFETAFQKLAIEYSLEVPA